MSELILPTDLIPNGVLPLNWVCVFDKKRHAYYYYNKVTRQKTWYLEIVSKQDGYLESYNAQNPRIY